MAYNWFHGTWQSIVLLKLSFSPFVFFYLSLPVHRLKKREVKSKSCGDAQAVLKALFSVSLSFRFAFLPC